MSGGASLRRNRGVPAVNVEQCARSAAALTALSMTIVSADSLQSSVSDEQLLIAPRPIHGFANDAIPLRLAKSPHLPCLRNFLVVIDCPWCYH